VAAVEGWAERTPPDFVFTVKASRYLTHVKLLADMREGVRLFYERIEPLIASGKLGPLLWQLPPTFRRDDERLAAALGELPEGRHAFEFRHETWFEPEVYDLLRRRHVALVIGDTPERRYQSHELTADWTFVRFHYGSRGRHGNYSDREIEEWANRIDGWRKKVEVFAYFNNDWNGFAVRNGLALKKALQEQN
jgi:uncharacterized protein YecE (DUF72 family)